jgi:hypothetical protein
MSHKNVEIVDAVFFRPIGQLQDSSGEGRNDSCKRLIKTGVCRDPFLPFRHSSLGHLSSQLYRGTCKQRRCAACVSCTHAQKFQLNTQNESSAKTKTIHNNSNTRHTLRYMTLSLLLASKKKWQHPAPP